MEHDARAALLAQALRQRTAGVHRQAKALQALSSSCSSSGSAFSSSAPFSSSSSSSQEGAVVAVAEPFVLLDAEPIQAALGREQAEAERARDERHAAEKEERLALLEHQKVERERVEKMREKRKEMAAEHGLEDEKAGSSGDSSAQQQRGDNAGEKGQDDKGDAQGPPPTRASRRGSTAASTAATNSLAAAGGAGVALGDGSDAAEGPAGAGGGSSGGGSSTDQAAAKASRAGGKGRVARAKADSATPLESADSFRKKKWFRSLPALNAIAGERKVTQDVQDEVARLWDGFDTVLQKLRDFSQHTFPFLRRVNKADAPDYHEIIKNPMDLSTMQRKVNTGKYPDDAAFLQDFNLILSNCREYNTSPEAEIYVRHAAETERYGMQLIAQNIPELSDDALATMHQLGARSGGLGASSTVSMGMGRSSGADKRGSAAKAAAATITESAANLLGQNPAEDYARGTFIGTALGGSGGIVHSVLAVQCPPIDNVGTVGPFPVLAEASKPVAQLTQQLDDKVAASVAQTLPLYPKGRSPDLGLPEGLDPLDREAEIIANNSRRGWRLNAILNARDETLDGGADGERDNDGDVDMSGSTAEKRKSGSKQEASDSATPAARKKRGGGDSTFRLCDAAMRWPSLAPPEPQRGEIPSRFRDTVADSAASLTDAHRALFHKALAVVLAQHDHPHISGHTFAVLADVFEAKFGELCASVAHRMQEEAGVPGEHALATGILDFFSPNPDQQRKPSAPPLAADSRSESIQVKTEPGVPHGKNGSKHEVFVNGADPPHVMHGTSDFASRDGGGETGSSWAAPLDRANMLYSTLLQFWRGGCLQQSAQSSASGSAEAAQKSEGDPLTTRDPFATGLDRRMMQPAPPKPKPEQHPALRGPPPGFAPSQIQAQQAALAAAQNAQNPGTAVPPALAPQLRNLQLAGYSNFTPAQLQAVAAQRAQQQRMAQQQQNQLLSQGASGAAAAAGRQSATKSSSKSTKRSAAKRSKSGSKEKASASSKRKSASSSSSGRKTKKRKGD